MHDVGGRGGDSNVIMTWIFPAIVWTSPLSDHRSRLYINFHWSTQQRLLPKMSLFIRAFVKCFWKLIFHWKPMKLLACMTRTNGLLCRSSPSWCTVHCHSWADWKSRSWLAESWISDTDISTYRCVQSTITAVSYSVYSDRLVDAIAFTAANNHPTSQELI